MSTLKLQKLKHPTASVDNLTLDSSGNTTLAGIAKVASLMHPSGAGAAVAMDSAGRVTMPYQPAFTAYGNGAISWNAALTFTGTTVNIGGHFNLSTNRFTAPVAGTYVFHVDMRLQSSNVAQQDIPFAISKNGSNAQGIQNDPAFYPANIWGAASQTAIIQMAAGDYVEVRMFGGVGGVDMRWLSGHLIG